MSNTLCEQICGFLFNLDEKNDIQFALNYLKEMFDYNIVGGKGTRGKTVVNTYQHLAGLNSNDEKLKQAEILGFCIELLQASFLVHDDIMDNSEMRRQKPCWYLKAKERGHGLIGVNDGIFLNTAVYKILIHYFRSEPYFVDLIELFNGVIYRTCTGQCLDMLTGAVTFAMFTKERYESIVKWKTAYYSFYLPVISGMIVGGITDRNIWLQVESILLKIGEYFQIQDDFLDCYGDPMILGKIGRDIEDFKCSWLIVQAIQSADKDQLRTLEANYGKEDLACVGRVKEIFTDLHLERVYHTYEEEAYKEVNSMITELPLEVSTILPARIFTDLLDKIHKRDK